jgi:hypothetical protein
MKRLQKLGLKIKKLIQENQFILYLFIFFLAFFIYLWIQSTPTFLDPDSFYHLKMAKLIGERGPIINFPWLQFTVLKDYYIDHHFLYHVLAIPFVKWLGDFAGFKFYTVILATLFIFLSYLFFKKEKITYPEIFALALLFSPALMFRISLAKATAFSLILLFLGIHFIFRRQYWLLALISFLYVWSYGGFLLIFLMTLIFALANSLEKTFINKAFWPKRIKNYIFYFIKNLFLLENLKIILASFLGIVLGLVLNPYFPKNLKFYWQQLIEIGLINYRGLVNVGGEWYPYDILNLIPDSGVAFIFTIVALILFIILFKKQKAQSIFFFIATLLFFFLTLKSKRYVEYFIPFSVYFCTFTFGFLLAEIKLKDYINKLRKEIPVFEILEKPLYTIFFVFILIMAKDAFITHQSFLGGIDFQDFAGISKYLYENSKAGEIVMQTDWDDFPMLFYHNDKNYYIVGLDPTFMYNYDKNLYNLFADITMAKKSNNLYQEIKNNFHASYFIVDEDRLQLAKNLQNDGNFTKVYEDTDGSVYKLKKD